VSAMAARMQASGSFDILMKVISSPALFHSFLRGSVRDHTARMILLGSAQHTAITRQLDNYVAFFHYRGVTVCVILSRMIAWLVSMSHVLHCVCFSFIRMRNKLANDSTICRHPQLIPCQQQCNCTSYSLTSMYMYLRTGSLDLTM
jgi:hypothetical protein